MVNLNVVPVNTTSGEVFFSGLAAVRLVAVNPSLKTMAEMDMTYLTEEPVYKSITLFFQILSGPCKGKYFRSFSGMNEERGLAFGSDDLFRYQYCDRFGRIRNANATSEKESLVVLKKIWDGLEAKGEGHKFDIKNCFLLMPDEKPVLELLFTLFRSNNVHRLLQEEFKKDKDFDVKPEHKSFLVTRKSMYSESDISKVEPKTLTDFIKVTQKAEKDSPTHSFAVVLLLNINAYTSKTSGKPVINQEVTLANAEEVSKKLNKDGDLVFDENGLVEYDIPTSVVNSFKAAINKAEYAMRVPGARELFKIEGATYTYHDGVEFLSRTPNTASAKANTEEGGTEEDIVVPGLDDTGW